MNLNLDDLKPLADVLLEKGVPLLANIFLPGIGGVIAGAIVPSLAQAFGLTSEASVAEITAAVQADPDAAIKLEGVKEQHSELLDFADKAISANATAIAAEPSFWGRLYVGGWRPAMGWACVTTVVYQTVASVKGYALVPIEHFLGLMGVFTGMAGIRGWELGKGVARTSLATAATLLKKGR